jgi:hypothetical protein
MDNITKRWREEHCGGGIPVSKNFLLDASTCSK